MRVSIACKIWRGQNGKNGKIEAPDLYSGTWSFQHDYLADKRWTSPIRVLKTLYYARNFDDDRWFTWIKK